MLQLKSKSKSEINTSSGEKINSLDNIAQNRMENLDPLSEEGSNFPAEEKSQTRNSNLLDSGDKLRSGYLSKSEDEASRRTSKKVPQQNSLFLEIEQHLNEDLNSDSSASEDDKLDSESESENLAVLPALSQGQPRKILQEDQNSSSGCLESSKEANSQGQGLVVPSQSRILGQKSSVFMNPALREDVNSSSSSDSDDESPANAIPGSNNNKLTLIESGRMISMMVHQRQNTNTPCFHKSKTISQKSSKKFQVSKMVGEGTQNLKSMKSQMLRESFGSKSSLESSLNSSNKLGGHERGRTGLISATYAKPGPTPAINNFKSAQVQIKIIGPIGPQNQAQLDHNKTKIQLSASLQNDSSINKNSDPIPNYFLLEDAGESDSDSDGEHASEKDDSVGSLSHDERNLLETTSNKQNAGVTPVAGKRDQHGMNQSALMKKYLQYTKTPQAREGG